MLIELLGINQSKSLDLKIFTMILHVFKKKLINFNLQVED